MCAMIKFCIFILFYFILFYFILFWSFSKLLILHSIFSYRCWYSCTTICTITQFLRCFYVYISTYIYIHLDIHTYSNICTRICTLDACKDSNVTWDTESQLMQLLLWRLLVPLTWLLLVCVNTAFEAPKANLIQPHAYISSCFNYSSGVLGMNTIDTFIIERGDIRKLVQETIKGTTLLCCSVKKLKCTLSQWNVVL